MPIFHVSGGGSALQDALLSTVYNATNVFQIEDGVYDQLVFSSNTITANGGAIGYNTKFILSSVNGAENCIVDGGTVWENDVFGGTMLSAGKRCLIHSDTSLTPESFNLSCCGITFRNGYVFNGSGAGTFFRSGNNKMFYDCIVERCFCEVSASNTTATNFFSSTGTLKGYRCKFRDIIGNRQTVANNIYLYNSEISNVKTQYAQSILEGSHIYNCIIHDIDNNKGSLTRYSGQVRNSLFYNIPACQLFEACRGSMYGNTFAMNGTYTGALFGWNTNAKQIIANNVFSTGALASRLSGPEVIVMNNYARSFSGNADRLSGNIAGYDPLFADPINLNFRLSKYSPCISAGNANWLSGYYSQYDLDKRRFKNPPSMGAYQFNIRNADMPNMAFPMGGREEKISELGYDAQVEYVATENPNTSKFIDTGVTPKTAGFAMFIRFQRTRSSTWAGIGSGVFNGQRVLLTKESGVGLYVGSNHYYVQASYNTLLDYSLDTRNNTITVGNETLGITSWDISDAGLTNLGGGYNFYLFGVNANRTSISPYDTGRFYSAKFYIGENLVRDLIPVRIGKIGYVFDKVSNKILGNFGTNELIPGPDIQA